MNLKASSDIIFTRYLYIKQEVELNLLVSILNQSKDSLFWAYELYFTGFKHELFSLIVKIYYDFFATLNPTFANYLLTKYNDFFTNDTVLCSIINTILLRPFNTDIFLLTHVCSEFNFDIDYHASTEKITHIDDLRINFTFWLNTNNYRSIAKWILNINNDTIQLNEIYLLCLELTNVKPNKKFLHTLNSTLNKSIHKNIILLSNIMNLISQKHNLKKGKNIYYISKEDDIVPYKTITFSNQLKNYRILQKVCTNGIDDLKHLSLFKLNRFKYNLKQIYCNNWEYFASFSPLWHQRIINYGGIIEHNTQKVIFNDDDLLEEFYRIYGYEPDEQPQNIQDKSIMTIEKKYNWKWFYNKYKYNALFIIWDEELEEFDVDSFTY